MEKISVFGKSPLIIPQQKYTQECLIYCVILSYHALETIVSIRRNSTSLFAYNHMDSGLITSVLGQIIRDKYIILARVLKESSMGD